MILTPPKKGSVNHEVKQHETELREAYGFGAVRTVGCQAGEGLYR